MPIKLLTLNIEGSRHLARVAETLQRHDPDVVCLQEVMERDCTMLAAAGGYRCLYSANAIMREKPPHPAGSWGVAILTRLAVRATTEQCYTEARTVEKLMHNTDSRRMLLVAELQHEAQDYRIITTHFTWSTDGQVSDRQQLDFARLRQCVSRYPDYVLCGDFNAPRGRLLFSRFLTDLQLIDHLPAEISSTLDARHHRIPQLRYVVDTIFSTPGYSVAGVEVLEGISDHKGILGTLAVVDGKNSVPA